MPDWISRTLGRVLRSRELTNSSRDNAIVVSWILRRRGFYKNLWLLAVTCLQWQSLLIISSSNWQDVTLEPNEVTSLQLLSLFTNSSLRQAGSDPGAKPGWSSSRWGGQWERREEAGDKRCHCSFCGLISFWHWSRAGRGWVSLSESKLPSKGELASCWLCLLLTQVCIHGSGKTVWGQRVLVAYPLEKNKECRTKASP
jgi:hypothetical protein